MPAPSQPYRTVWQGLLYRFPETATGKVSTAAMSISPTLIPTIGRHVLEAEGSQSYCRRTVEYSSGVWRNTN